MKIVSFGSTQGARVGALLDDAHVVDLNRADARIPSDLLGLIEAGEGCLDLVRALVHEPNSVPEPAVLDLSAVKLLAPWPGRRIAMAGGNNARHLRDALKEDARPDGRSLEQVIKDIRSDGPWGFWKNLGWVTDPGDPVPSPSGVQHLDYEGEVAIIFGKRAKRIDAGEISDYVWGVTLLNDWSNRDDKTARRALSLNLHKNFDGSCTLGPWIVVDELDPDDIDVVTSVNGEVRQRYNTKDLVFGFGEWTAAVTENLSMLPGDMLAGGTGEGTAVDIVGLQHLNEPEPTARWFLKPGDVVTVESPQIGRFENQVTRGDEAELEGTVPAAAALVE